MEHGIIFYSQPTIEIAALAVYALLAGSNLDFVCSSSPEDMRRVSPVERDALYGTSAQPKVNLNITQLELKPIPYEAQLQEYSRGIIPGKYKQAHQHRKR